MVQLRVRRKKPPLLDSSAGNMLEGKQAVGWSPVSSVYAAALICVCDTCGLKEELWDHQAGKEGGEDEFRDPCVHLCLWCIQELKPGGVEGG